MSAAEYSPKALDDLKAIFDYIVRDRPEAAARTVERVLHRRRTFRAGYRHRRRA